MPTVQLPQALKQVWKSEQQLADAFFVIADRDDDFYDLRRGCTLFGHWSFGHAVNLDEFMAKYSGAPAPEPVPVHVAPFPARPAGGDDLRAALQELLRLAQETRSAWTTLAEAAKEANDAELRATAARCAAESDRQLVWLNNQLRNAPPQANTRRVAQVA